MRISVIIPVYNCELWLEESVASALQFDQVREVLLIDDGSTDNSPELINDLAENDHRIVKLSHKNHINKGRSASRNLGIEAATQPWIAFLDADDYYLPNRFDGIDWDNHLDGYYGTIVSESPFNPDENDLLTGVPMIINPEQLFGFLTEQSEHYFSIISMTIRRESLLSTTLFDEQLMVGEDTDLIWRLAHDLNLARAKTQDSIAVRRVHEPNNEREDSERVSFYAKWLNHPPYPITEVARKRMFYAYEYYKAPTDQRSRFYKKLAYTKWKLSKK